MPIKLVTRLGLFALASAFAWVGSAAAGEQPVPAELALLAPPCEANASLAEPAVPELLDPSALEDLPLTPAEPEEKAVTCGSWIYNGCCISQTKYRRRCQFNPAEWWYEYKCQGVCMM